MAKKKPVTGNSDKKPVFWKVNTKALFEEIIASNPGMWIMQHPLGILQGKLLKIAEVACKAQNTEIMRLCCQLGLYAECDPYSPDYDKEKAEKLLQEKKD